MTFSSNRTTGSLLILTIVSLFSGTLQAQPLDLTFMPASVVNQPDYDLFGLRRPALSITGFDNREPGYDPAFGLGLRQVLEERFDAENPLVVPVFDRLIVLAHETQQNPYVVGGPDLTQRRFQLNHNVAILQGRAFEALVTFVLELNGHDPGALVSGMRSHGEALAELREALVNPPGGLVYGDWIDDYVKYGTSVTGVARAIDLYLALENAYLQVLGGAIPPFAGLRPDLLLTEAERVGVTTEMATALLVQETVLTLRAVDLYAEDLEDLLSPEQVEYLLWKLEHSPVGDRTVEEVEAGNWAIKQRVSAGYGALVIQMPPDDPYAGIIRALKDKAVRSLTVTHQGDKSRLHQWNWMTYGGLGIWPESTYYFDYALEEILPFWHAMRANGLVEAGQDPFFSPWFTDVLRWHADLVGPDGRLTSQDDGNRVVVKHSGLMRWDGGYGDAGIGRKYAWIEEVLGGPARRTDNLLVELAIPRTTAVQAPPDRVGNPKGPIQANRSEQQLIVRSTPPGEDTHFLFLNGEHGVAVDRGEGHEQADQLNLLYYVGGVSYLADSGYDRGFTVANSTWNHYYDHNVMTVGGGEGGLSAPSLEILEVRKASDYMDMGQVDALFYEDHGLVTVLHGQQVLQVADGNEYKADYTRDVLFVDGDEPYVVDLNRIQHRETPPECEANEFAMRYHLNSDDVIGAEGYSPSEDGFLVWNQVDSQIGKTIHVFPMSVEFTLEAADVHVEADQIYETDLRDIRKLVLSRPDRCVPFWTVATVLRPGDAGSSAPDLVWASAEPGDRQGWVWQRTDDEIDVFVARSAANAIGDVHFSLADAGAGYPDFDMVLPSHEPYGFARLHFDQGAWSIDPDRVIGFASGSAVRMVESRRVEAGKTSPRESTYGLSEAWPSPGNPMASFTLRLRASEHVTIAVFDILGRQVAVLHSGVLSEETPHQFRIDASNLGTGMYLVRAQGETFSQTRSVMLLK